MAETLIGMTDSPRTRVTVTPVAQVTGTFRTRSQSSIYSNVPRSYNVRVPPGVMSALESVTQDSHERNRWYVQRVSPSRAIAPRYRFPRDVSASDRAGTANSIGKRNVTFFSFFFSPPSLLPPISAPVVALLRIIMRIITSQFTQDRERRVTRGWKICIIFHVSRTIHSNFGVNLTQDKYIRK